MDPFRILLVVTSADRMGSAPDPTGSWLEEVAAPYYAFLDTRCDVTIASPKGGVAPVDETSLKEENLGAAARRFQADAKAQHALAHTIKLLTVDPAYYDAVFFAGGHGTMDDFPVDVSVRSIVESFYAAEKPLSAVCHGPACFVGAKKPDGTPLIEGYHFTCFSNAEETTVGLAKLVPFMLETKLREQGGIPQIAAPFTSNVVIEGSVVTGQNPASAIPVAEAVIYQLRNRGRKQRAA
jgi:putative intracellular protease/amidase